METLALLVFILMVALGFKGCSDSHEIRQLENNIKSEKPFTLTHEYQCHLTEKGKKQQALEKELRELK